MAVRFRRPSAPRHTAVAALRWVSVAALATFSSRTSQAQTCDVFGPLDGGARVSQALSYDQIWSTPARTGSDWTLVWSAGQDVVLRRFTSGLVPVGNDTLVNTTLNLEVQDEPAIGVANGGNFLVAWSERHGYDGQQMGIFGRVYTSAGSPIGPEFRVNQAWAASQWRPLIAPTPAGGFVVAWSGDWDGDAYLRVLSATGSPLTGDVMINQYEFDAQVDPAVAVAPDGTIFAAFVDFSSHGGVGSNLNLWGRRFSASGTPLGNEFPLPSTFVNGDQRLPRVGADGLGRFVVVWQDAQADGSSSAIALRRFDVLGNALGPDVVVNTTTAGAQTSPEVAVDPDGSFLVAWEDWSQTTPRARGRRYASDGSPNGPEFPLSPPGVWAERPAPWSDAASGTTVVGYDVWNGTDYDVHARRFLESSGPQTYCSAKTNSQNCVPAITSSGAPSVGSGAPFTLGAVNVISQKYGLLVYSTASAFTPFQGGTLCVANPRRIGSQTSGGTPGAPTCTGTFAFDFNAFVRSGADPVLTIGTTVSAQWYYRDVLDPAGFGSGLTNALRFTLCP
ncbi:MAG: hypothetical protein NTY35_10590 [Planctomycetota bacterium]|nr:hypothetical protein [Planctomycetota bacterium]